MEQFCVFCWFIVANTVMHLQTQYAGVSSRYILSPNINIIYLGHKQLNPTVLYIHPNFQICFNQKCIQSDMSLSSTKHISRYVHLYESLHIFRGTKE